MATIKNRMNIKSEEIRENDSQVSYKLSQYEPIGDRILLQRDESEYKTKGGLYLPDQAQTPKYEGLIVAIGKGELLSEWKIKKGMRVLVGKYSGIELVIEDKEYILCEAEDIMMIIKEKTNESKMADQKEN